MLQTVKYYFMELNQKVTMTKLLLGLLTGQKRVKKDEGVLPCVYTLVLQIVPLNQQHLAI